MPAGNDVDIVRVFARQVNGAIAEVTFPTDQDFEVILEAEAGATVHKSGAQYQAGIAVRDLTNGTVIPAANDPNTPDSGHMKGVKEWPKEAYAIKYTVAKANLAGRANHVLEVLAFVTEGVSDVDASFATSPPFILTVP
ncbi:MAG: hypothetical protein HYR94_11870 [Chloroflexi bacterium]|nr:hypothetical protein [Chloroflexota bacterium]